MKLTRYLILFTLVGMTIGMASAQNTYADSPAFEETDSVVITDNWSNYLDTTQSHLSVENGNLIYSTQGGDEITETMLSTTSDAVYTNTEVDSVNTAGGDSTSMFMAYPNQASWIEKSLTTGSNEISVDNSYEKEVKLFDSKSTVTSPGSIIPIVTFQNNHNNLEPDTVDTINVSIDDDYSQNYTVNITEDRGTPTTVGSATSPETVDYTVPNSSVSQFTIDVTTDDGESNSFTRYYYPETGQFVKSYMTYELESFEVSAYDRVAIDNYIPGQTANFNLSVSHTGYPDQKYEDGTMEEYYSKSLVYKGTTESGESIQESKWEQIEFPNSEGNTETEINSEEEFSVQRYDAGDYTAVLALAQVDGTYNFETDSWELTEEEVDRHSYSWTVTQADSPTSPLTDLQNFFSSILESIIGIFDSEIDSVGIGTPSVSAPPTGPSQ